MNLNHMIRTGIAVLLFGTVGSCMAGVDVMVAAGTKTEGAFEGFENSRFLFRTTKGHLIRQYGSQVSKLTLETPRNALVTNKDIKKTQDKVVLKGFERNKFEMEKDGKPDLRPMDKIARIELEMDDRTEGVQGGQAVRVDVIDTDALIAGLGGQAPNQAQSNAIEKYKEATQAFVRFADNTETLKGEMDRATDARRIAILEQLRVRKHDEQGILDRLAKAENEIMAAFQVMKIGGRNSNLPAAPSAL